MRIPLKLLLVISLPTGFIFAQEAAIKEVDPFSAAPHEEGAIPVSWDVTCEVFSIPLVEAADLKRKGLKDDKLYEELVSQLDLGKVRQEEFLTVRTVCGSTTTSEEVSEVIYASEYEPPELPNEIGNLPDDLEKAKLLVTPAMPSAFDTKNVGSTMEIELQPDGGKAVQVKVNLSLVSYLGREKWGQDEATAEMPKFTNQKVRTNIAISHDSPAMIGTVSPPAVLQKEENGKRVWLAFLTVSE